LVNLPTLIVLIISTAVTTLPAVALVAWFVSSTFVVVTIEWRVLFWNRMSFWLHCLLQQYCMHDLRHRLCQKTWSYSVSPWVFHFTSY